MSILFIDFETRSGGDIRKRGSFRYINDKEFSILLTSYAFNGKPVVVSGSFPEDVRAYLEDDSINKQICVHNSMFEMECFRHLGINVNPNRVIDTMQIARSLAYPASLGKLSEFLGVQQKLSIGTALISYFCKPNKLGEFNSSESDIEKWRLFRKYAAFDVIAMRECYNKMGDNAPDWEKKLRAVDYYINASGIRIDIPLANKTIDMASGYVNTLSDEFRAITGFNPTQREKILGWVNSHGVDLPDLKAGTVRDVLKTELPTEVKKVMAMKAILSKTSIKKLDAMVRYAGEDNRARGLLQYHRATTGRWGGSGIQIQNMPRGNIKKINEATQALETGDLERVKKYGNPLDVISSCLRGMLIPADGKVFNVVDFAAIEARVVNWVAGQEDRLELYRKGEDLYKHMAATIYNILPSKVNKQQRALGKTAVLACGYGMGAVKFKSTCGNMGVKVTEELAAKAVLAYRDTHYKVTGLWSAVERCFIKCIRNRSNGILRSAYTSLEFIYSPDGVGIKLPSGRIINYPKAELRKGVTPWGSEVDNIYFYGAETGRVEWKMQSTYGGKIVENCIQGIARDVMGVALIKLHSVYRKIAFHVHDEVVLEGNSNELDYVCGIMKEVPEWADGLPIEVEGFNCNRYKK